MRDVSTDRQSGFNDVTIRGAIRGAILGACLWPPLHYTLTKRSANYRALPLPLKAFGAVVVFVPCISISAEKAGEAYGQAEWSGVGKEEMDLQRAREEERLRGMTAMERATEWAKGHKYQVIMGSWLASMGIAFGIVARNPYQTFAQKLVQARMYAQGLTVGTLITSAVVAGTTPTSEAKPVFKADHSWEDILEAEGQMKHEDRLEIIAAAKKEVERRNAASGQSASPAKNVAQAAAEAVPKA